MPLRTVQAKQKSAAVAAVMATSGPQTLKQTLNNEGVIPNSLQHFKAFLREEKDGNDDTDNAKGDCELHLEFVMEVDKLIKSDLKTLAKKYFSPDPKGLYLEPKIIHYEWQFKYASHE